MACLTWRWWMTKLKFISWKNCQMLSKCISVLLRIYLFSAVKWCSVESETVDYCQIWKNMEEISRHYFYNYRQTTFTVPVSAHQCSSWPQAGNVATVPHTKLSTQDAVLLLLNTTTFKGDTFITLIEYFYRHHTIMSLFMCQSLKLGYLSILYTHQKPQN